MLLPQPFLESLLVLVGEQDTEGFSRAITHLTTNTYQRQAATAALLELDKRSLSRRRTIEEIGQNVEFSGWKSLSDDATKAKNVTGIVAVHDGFTQVRSEVAAALTTTSSYQKLTSLNRARKQLDELRDTSILRLRGSEARVFAQVAQQWLEAVNTEINRLTEEERFTETIPNPYIAPRPLTLSDDIFIGRSEVFRFVEEHFLRASQNTAIVLHGQPRIGKSSVLRHLAAHLSTDLISVYVDMQRAAQVESTGGLLYNLADTIAHELIIRGARLNAPALADFAAEPFIVFGKFLDAVEKAINAPKNRIILTLDEFEEIERKLTEGKVSLDLMPFLRNMMQHRPGFSLLFAGTHTLDEMIADHWVPYFRSAMPCRVSYLSEPDARKLITNPIPEFTLEYEADAVDHLLEITHCHPCLIQLTCSALVDSKNRQRSRSAKRVDVEQALTEALEKGDYVFRGIWEWIPLNERNLLTALAMQKQMNIAALARTLRKPDEETRRMCERLKEAEVLENGSGPNRETTYRFQVELFRQWVERYAIPVVA